MKTIIFLKTFQWFLFLFSLFTLPFFSRSKFTLLTPPPIHLLSFSLFFVYPPLSLFLQLFSSFLSVVLLTFLLSLFKFTFLTPPLLFFCFLYLSLLSTPSLSYSTFIFFLSLYRLAHCGSEDSSYFFNYVFKYWIF